MSRKIPVWGLIAALALSVLLTFQLTYYFIGNKYQKKLDELILSDDSADQSDTNVFAETTEVTTAIPLADIIETEIISEGVGLYSVYDSNSGVYIIDGIIEGSEASAAELSVGDCIEKINSQSVTSSMLLSLATGDILTILRNGTVIEITL